MAGLCASVLYPVLLFAPRRWPRPPRRQRCSGRRLALAVSASASSSGFTAGHDGALGAITNFGAGALFTAMALIQLAVRHAGADSAPQRDLIGVGSASMSPGMFTSVLALSFLHGPCSVIRASAGRSLFPASSSGSSSSCSIFTPSNPTGRGRFVQRRTVRWSLVSGRHGAGLAQHRLGWSPPGHGRVAAGRLRFPRFNVSADLVLLSTRQPLTHHRFA